MDPLFFLNQDNYAIYNRNLATLLGVTAAIILSELIQRRKYHTDRDELIDDPKLGNGWFYETIDTMQERLGLTRREQDTALKKLKKTGLISIKVVGIPPKRHFLINDENVLQLFTDANSQKVIEKTTNLHKNAKSICTKAPNQFAQKRQINLCKSAKSTYIKNPIEEPNKILSSSKVSPEQQDPDGSKSAKADQKKLKNFKNVKEKEEGFPAEVTELATNITNKLQIENPDYLPPKGVGHLKFLKTIDAMLRIDKRSPAMVFDILLFTLRDDFWRPHVFVADPAAFIRKKFVQLQEKMRIKPKEPERKFLPSSDTERALEMLRERKARSM